MGRIKTMFIKRAVRRLISESKDKFNQEFEHNKKTIPEFADVPSKKMRNVMAGYITRLMKVKK